MNCGHNSRTRKQTVHFKTDFGPASRWKDNNVAAIVGLLEVKTGPRKKEALKRCSVMHASDELMTQLMDFLLC